MTGITITATFVGLNFQIFPTPYTRAIQQRITIIGYAPIALAILRKRSNGNKLTSRNKPPPTDP